MPSRSKSPKRSMSPKRKASKSPKRVSRSKSPKRKMSVRKATVAVVTLPVKMAAGAVSPLVPKRKVSKSPKRKVSKSPKRKVSKSPKRKVSKSPKRKVSKSPKRKVSKSPKRKVSKSPKRMSSKRVSKKPVMAAVMDGMDQKPEVVSMMAPLPAPGMIVGAAVADAVDTMTPKRKTVSRSKSPKKTKSKSKAKSRSKSPKRAASPRKVKVLAFGMMPSEATAKPMSPRRMSKTKSA